jgi:subtilisin-like proprotein convertase family protein
MRRIDWLATRARRLGRPIGRQLHFEQLEDRRLLAINLNFAGQGYTSVVPPDTVGDVGPANYVQVVNNSASALVTVYNKANGSVAVPAFRIDSLSSTAKGASPYTGGGDPVVVYDKLANRWVLMEFETSGNDLDIFISDTSTPTNNGANWTQYHFAATNFPDYAKITVWPNAYLIGTNESDDPVYVLDRGAMLSGSGGLVTPIRRTAPPRPNWPFDHTMPVEFDGSTLPPAGAPGMFLRQVDDELTNPGGANPNFDFLELWAFTPNFVTPANSTYVLAQSIPITEFSMVSTTVNDISQPGTSTKLDGLDDVFMWRPQYRNFGSYETIVGDFCVDDAATGAGQAGVRWFELRRSGGGSWSVFQQGTLAPDGTNRFDGSIAMNGAGDIALGYTVSSSTVFPGMRYSGRLASDPLGTMPRGEFTIINGSSSQADNRWGDYSAMTVDPVNDRTFWFTSEYIPAGGNWATRIASIDLAPPVGIDLLGTAFTVSPNSLLYSGGFANTNFSVANQGSTAAPAFDVKFYLSDDANIDPASDVLLTLDPSAAYYDPGEPSAYHVTGGLAGLGSLNAAIRVVVPVGDPFGTDNQYYMGMVVDADGNAAETDETNNRNRGDGIDRQSVTYSSTFTNPGSISIPNSGTATPYPSTINVAGATGTLADVNVSLFGFTHTFPDDIDILLVGPAGQKLLLMSDVGGSNDVSGVNLVFDDSAASSLPNSGQITSGTFKPTNFGGSDTFGSPAPGGPYSSTLSVFQNTAPNGTWSLYVVDDSSSDSGSFSGGWGLTFVLSNTAPTNPTNLSLPAIEEDISSGSNSGRLVSSIVSASGSTDADGNTLGIAVTAVDNSHGQWQYSTNGGGSWQNLTGVSLTSARLLGPTHYVRFLPNADFNSLIAASPTFGFKAWDQTSGSAGGTANTTTGSAFSAAAAQATQPVTAVNDAPSFALASTTVSSNEDAGPVSVSGFATNLARGPATATDEAGQTLTFLVSVVGQTGTLAFASSPAINSTTGALSFTTSADTNGSATVDVVLQDNGSGTPPNVNQSAVQVFTINIGPVNDEQVLAVNAGLTLDRGAAAAITTAMLQTTDIDNSPAELVYTVSTGPTHGTLLVSGSAASQFTQQQIDAGAVSYQHDGTATLSDSFAFTVDDGQGTSSAGTFQITIRPFAGDYDADRVVNASDYVLWRKTAGTTGVTPYSGADGDGDGNIDQPDYDVWRSNFGNAMAVAAAGNGEARASEATPSLRTLNSKNVDTNSSSQPAGGFGFAAQFASGVRKGDLHTQTIEIRPVSNSVLEANRRDDGLLAWLRSAAGSAQRDTRAVDAADDGQNCPSHESAVDDALEAGVGLPVVVGLDA